MDPRPSGARRGRRVRAVRRGRATAIIAATACVLGALRPDRAAAQDEATRLADACASSNPGALASACLESALAVQAVQGLVGLSASGGSELPGSSSTLGKRFGGTPRLAFTAGISLVRGDLPVTLAPPAGVASADGVSQVAFHTAGSAGIFQGFSMAPTIGGILAVDALATFSYVTAPDRIGFEDPATGFGVGARIGILRESFTLPGVTLSLARRWMGTTSLSSTDGDEAEVGVTASSVRLTVGKEFLAFGLLGGAGWDRYSGGASVEVRPSGPSGPVGEASTSSFQTDRMLLYGGVGYTFLVAQVALEGGWAEGAEASPGRAATGFDPEASSLFARLSFRLTL